MSYVELASAIAQIINKKVPGRKEAAIKELYMLNELLGKALAQNEDLLASQIRKRKREVRNAFPDIE